MTQIEQIKAEIERRKNRTERILDNIVPIKRKDTMDENQLIKIELRDKVDKAYLNGVWITLSDILSFITSLQREQPSEDLEQAATSYSACGYSPFDEPYEKIKEFELAKASFIEGAKWQKEQMMKGAVEAEIYGYVGGDGVYVSADLPPRIKVDEGDKVNVIIVKED